MEEVRLSSKGQVVIPVKIRKKLGLVKDDILTIEESKNGILMKPKIKLSTLVGAFKIEGGSALLQKERDEDVELEDERLGLHRKKPQHKE